ncbi:MAG TPA: radical SAM protein, partial [Candidatus Dormibacteraeota bacterium]|nr:radical SAM protein [Candidatus Dormibacteraeota bacterium]
EKLLALDASAAAAYFQLQSYDQLLKCTVSLCPECLAHVPALVFARDGRVLMRKHCETHGFSEAVLENDLEFYHLSNKDRWGRAYATQKALSFPEFGSACGGGCGDYTGDALFADQSGNKSCTILVEVTNACNLACPVCYSDARGDRRMPLEKFKEYIGRLINQKGPLDSVQLTGGEAMLHPEFWEMVAFLHGERVKKIYLPTNGLLFADAATAARTQPFRDKLMVLLQFDGRTAESNQAMRHSNPAAVRQQVIENFGRLGVQMQLTMTITLGVNDDQVGWVVESAMRHPQIKVVALQPVTYSGRYELPQDPLKRMTLSDCVKAVVSQINRHAKLGDFKPIPCSHPNCGWITLFVQRFGVTANIARHIDLGEAVNRAANRTLLNSQELRSIVGTTEKSLLSRVGMWAGRKLIRSTDIFAIAIKPFMDRFNYDQDRVSACCHHLMDTKGNPVSFCEYNAIVRQGDSWNAFPPIRTTSARSLDLDETPR